MTTKLTDFDLISLTFDMFEDSEVMQEFEDCYWVKVDKEMYDTLCDNNWRKS